MSHLMTGIVVVTAVCVGVAVLAATVRVVRGPDDATRVVVADLIYFCALALFVLLVLATDSSAALDVLMLGSLIGVISTVALARLITRGRR